MRAKEYLEINKERILYYDIVRSAIDALSLLRNNKTKTEEYFNRYLFSDARYLAQKKDFVLREGEVDNNYVYDVRISIMNAVCCDESFIFTYNIILMQMNEYYSLIPIKFCKIKEINCNTIVNIENICRSYKENYPKSNLMGFLHDDDNSRYFESRLIEICKDESWWLEAFNEAYSIFDKMRLILHMPYKAQLLITEYENEDKDLENAVVDIVTYLVEGYDYDLNEKQKKEITLLSKMINAHFSKLNRKTDNDRISELENLLKEKDKIIESKDNTIESLKRTNESNDKTIETQNQDLVALNHEIANLKKEMSNRGLTISQQNIFFYYLFNELGITFDNSKKTDWAKLISTLNGKNEENIRKALSIKFDDATTKNDMMLIAEMVSDLFPDITQQILNDIS